MHATHALPAQLSPGAWPRRRGSTASLTVRVIPHATACRQAPHCAACSPAVLLTGMKASSVMSFYHATSYTLAAGVPLALVLGTPVNTLADLAFAFVIPMHAHIGMRSVIVDYVWDTDRQRAAVMLLGVFTVLMGGAMARLTLADVGLVNGVKSLWVRKQQPKL